MAAVNYSKTMSSLLFYHKKEKTLSHHRDRVWAGSSGSVWNCPLYWEENSTNESREPKIGGDEARRLCLTSSPADMEGIFAPHVKQRDSNFTCPVILFRITGWLNHARSGRTLSCWREVSGFGVAQTPTVNERQKSYFFSSPFCAARASLPMRPTCFAARSFISRCCGVASPRCTASAARL